MQIPRILAIVPFDKEVAVLEHILTSRNLDHIRYCKKNTASPFEGYIQVGMIPDAIAKNNNLKIPFHNLVSTRIIPNPKSQDKARAALYELSVLAAVSV